MFDIEDSALPRGEILMTFSFRTALFSGRSRTPHPRSVYFETGIAKATDGTLRFAETSADKIGRITTVGAIAEYAVPTAGAQPIQLFSGKKSHVPLSLARAADASWWFTSTPPTTSALCPHNPVRRKL